MQFLIDFHNTATDSEIQSYLTDNNCTVLKEWDNFDKVFLVETATEPPVTSIVTFVKDNQILNIQPKLHEIHSSYALVNYDGVGESVTISTTEDKDWWKNYSLKNPIFDESSTTIKRKGSKVRIYIMDSGIDSSHPEFINADISNVYTVTPGDYTDNKGHGTALASLIVGSTCGITNARIKNVKIFDPTHNTLQSELLNAFDAILNDVPLNHYAVVNCSWVIDKNEWVEHKIQIMLDRGVWVICAAGNQGTPIQNVTPASMAETFTVGSYNKDLQPSDFSNYTSEHLQTTQGAVNEGRLDGWAPGENIYVAKPTNMGGGYAFTSGTSLSTAITCAVCAYNLDDNLHADGLMNNEIEDFIIAGPDTNVGLICGRQGILELNDPKYADSINAIATLADLAGLPSNPAPDSSEGTVRVGQRKNVARAFNPHFDKSFTWTSVLPNFINLKNDGFLSAKPLAADGPSESEAFKLYTLTGTRINNEDQEETVTISLYVLAQSYDPNQLPEDHIVNILLQSGACATNVANNCGFAIFNPPCAPGCPSFADVCCDGGKSAYCLCMQGW